VRQPPTVLGGPRLTRRLVGGRVRCGYRRPAWENASRVTDVTVRPTFVLLLVAVLMAACGGAAPLAEHHGSNPATSEAAPSTLTSTTVAPRTIAKAPATTTTTSSPATTTTTPPTTTTTAPAPTVTTYPAVLTPITRPPPALRQPTAAAPLTILVIGDSLGEDLGLGMGSVLGSDPLVRVVQDAVGDTGLARPDYYDWPLHLEEELQQYHPGALVVMLGGNDGQDFYDGGAYIAFGSEAWHTVYSERVAQIMDEAALAGAHVMWVGMPIMDDPSFSATMETLNSVYSQQAADHAGVTYFSSWAVFTDASGGYAAELPDGSGQEVLMRDPDGVHLAYGGMARLATAIISPMESAWRIEI
jgi:hypothetical protein